MLAACRRMSSSLFLIALLLLLGTPGPAAGQCATAHDDHQETDAHCEVEPGGGHEHDSAAGSLTNPAISANALLVARAADETDARVYNGADLQKAEVRLCAGIDSRWTADIVFAVHAAGSHGHDEEGESAEHGSTYEGEVEVARVRALGLPEGMGLVIGKDFVPFGRHAALHLHEFPFVDAPAAITTFLGSHALSETGVRLSHELPVPWRGEVEAWLVDGSSPIFDAGSRDPACGARLVNSFGTGNLICELGASWLHGRVAHEYAAAYEGAESTGDLDVYGFDLSCRWFGDHGDHDPLLELTGEMLLPRPESGPDDPWGAYGHLRYNWRPNWKWGIAFGGMNRKSPQPWELVLDEGSPEVLESLHGVPWRFDRLFEAKANVTWAASESSYLRLEVARYEDLDGDDAETLLSLQFNFALGAHQEH